jgi:hypothetical protein
MLVCEKRRSQCKTFPDIDPKMAHDTDPTKGSFFMGDDISFSFPNPTGCSLSPNPMAAYSRDLQRLYTVVAHGQGGR